MKIAMLLVVYHEEERIVGCVEHHLLYFDDVIVVHDGPCSDRTIQLASERGAHCWETPEREGYCEPVREMARKRALMGGASWGAVIDADERWSPELLKDLRVLCTQFDLAEVTCAAINRVTHFLPEGSWPTRIDDLQARLFRLDSGTFSRIIHTNVHLTRGRMIDLLPHDKYYIDHFNVYDDFKEKEPRYTSIAKGLLPNYAPGTWQHNHLLKVLGE